MKKFLFLYAFIFAILFGVNNNLFAQAEPVLYFCESYGDDGEVGIADRFTTGFLTVMVKCDFPLNLTDCSIQYDKYNTRTRTFEFYKNFPFTIEPDMKYVFFSKTEDNDMKFEEPGFYRVFLLDNNANTIASSLVEIINR
jgi:hypothetical protein